MNNEDEQLTHVGTLTRLRGITRLQENAMPQYHLRIRTAQVHIAGITTRPDEAWMLPVTRNLTNEQGGALASKRYLIIDRDTKYSKRFRYILDESGIEIIRLPPMSPNLNSFAERFVRSSKRNAWGS